MRLSGLKHSFSVEGRKPFSCFMILSLFFLSFLSLTTWGQSSSLRCKKVKRTQQFFELDTLSLVPRSVSIAGINNPNAYQYLPASNQFKINTLALNDSLNAKDSLLICYRVFPFKWNKPLFLRDPFAFQQTARFAMETPDILAKTIQREELFSTPNISKTGTLSRGLSFGNTQNVFVNSQLNLQLQGYLTDDIKLTAVISDQQVPFQPEGNTQQIREFDRVYIVLENAFARLQAGDVVLENQADNSLLRFYKNVQGASSWVQYKTPIGKAKTEGAAAIAKGKFTSIFIPAIEGVQGPYRVRTPENDPFIIINANSERVFLDGRLLQRGFNQDYVIDYNLGQIVFNNTLPITRFSRIRVDFEYITRQYNRSIITVNHQQEIGKSTKLKIEHYQEGDNENRPLGFTASPALIAQLAAAGDNQLGANISGATRVTSFNSEQVLYTLVPNPQQGADSVFELITSAQAKMFSVVFTDFGPNRGDYELSSANQVNGRVFRYVGRGRGNFLPVRNVALPTSLALTTAQIQQKWSAKFSSKVEFAQSNTDLNLYDNSARSLRQGAGIINKNEFKEIALGERYQWNGALGFEFLQARFRGIDRFRSIEFERDWTARAGDTLAANDILSYTEGKISAAKKQDKPTYYQSNFNYRLAQRSKGENVNALQGEFAATQSIGRFLLEGNYFQLRNATTLRSAEWRRNQATLSYIGKTFTPGIRFAEERNAITGANRDSIVSTANNFSLREVFLRSSADSAKLKYTLLYSQRRDRLPLEGVLLDANTAFNYTGELSYTSLKGNSINLNLTYRELRNENDNLNVFNADARSSVFGRLDWNGNYFKRILKSELTYTLNNTQELAREFRYIRTPILGEGTHFYLGDLNNNGLQDLDEFVEASRPEQREYIRVFVPTTTFIQAFGTLFNYRYGLQAPLNWKQKKGILGFLAKFSDIGSIVINRRTSSENLTERLNPFGRLQETALIASEQNIRNGLFFNRSSAIYGAEYTFSDNSNKQLLTGGFEERSQREHKLSSRASINAFLAGTVTYINGTRSNESDVLLSRNFNIENNYGQVELSLQPNNKYRISLQTGAGQRINTLGTEASNYQRISAELRYNQLQNRVINAGISLNSMRFRGESTITPAAFEVLDALQPGMNILWNLNWQQKLFDGLQLRLNYDGRKSAGLAVIHTGTVQVSALF